MPTDLPTVLAGVTELVGRRTLTQNEYQNWAGGSPVGGPNNDGHFPFTDPAGNQRLVPSPARIAADSSVPGPQSFGAIGDGRSHPARDFFPTLAACQAVYPFARSLAQEMDWLGWQKMINTFGTFVSPTLSYIMDNADQESWVPLNWIAGRCEVDAGFSYLRWHHTQPKIYTDHPIANYAFQAPGGWRNSGQYLPSQITLATFDTGAARCIDIHDGTTGTLTPYYEFYHQTFVPEGRWQLVIEGTLSRGVSYDHGNFNPPYASMNIGGLSKSVSIPIGLDVEDPVGTPKPFEAKIDFIIGAAGQTVSPTFHGGGYSNFIITRFDIIKWPDHYAIIYTRDGSPEHYFLPKRLSRARLRGREGYAFTGSGIWAAIWHSFQDIDGSLHEWDQVEVSDFHGVAEGGDGCYLLNFYDCFFRGNGLGGGFFMAPGRLNAGENLKFYGGEIVNSSVAIFNPGSAEISFFGTVIDYNGFACKRNTGKLRFIGTRHEQRRYPDEYIWDVGPGGRVIYVASFILIAGVPATANLPPAFLESSTSSLEFHSTECYNLNCSDEGGGVVASGAGRVVFNGHVNSGQPALGPLLLTEAPNQDVLGGAGNFEPNGHPFPVALDRSGIFLEGGVFGSAGRTVIDRWNTQDVKVDISTDFHKVGTRSMRVRKIGHADNQILASLHLLVPMQGVGNLLGKFYMNFPNALEGYPLPPELEPDPKGPPVYFRQFWVRVIGKDEYGRPIYGGAQVFKGELDVFLPINGSTEWVYRYINTSFSPPQLDPVLEAGDRSPAWATHLLILIDMQSLPETTFYIDDLKVNFIG